MGRGSVESAQILKVCVFLQLEAIGGLTDDMRRHFRMKLRNLLSKLIRKFGLVLNLKGANIVVIREIKNSPHYILEI